LCLGQTELVRLLTLPAKDLFDEGTSHEVEGVGALGQQKSEFERDA
jgi:hypothetical protein